MNRLAAKQNAAKQVERLAAQRQLYAVAKSVFAGQFVLAGPIPAGTAFLSLLIPELKVYTALWGISVSLVDLLVLTPWQKRLKNKAAIIQELFDCEVLQLPWNELKSGRFPEAELIAEQARKYQRRAGKMPLLTNWYAVEVSEVPLHIGRLACQRSNCLWDSKQRRYYAALVVAGVSVVSLVVLALGLYKGLTLENFVLQVIAPFAPTFTFGIRQTIEHLEAAACLERLQAHSEQLWNKAMAGLPESEMTSKSRALQDEIFESRRRSALVIDWIYRKLQPKNERVMKAGVATLVAEAKHKLRL